MLKLKKIFKIILVCYATVMGLLYFFQERIIFQPEQLPANYTFSFDHVFEELFFETKDGARLHGLHFRNESPRGVILYFHGNRGSLKRWGNITEFFVKKNYDVVIMDYRTYGKSTGKLTENNLYTDAQLFYNYVKKHYSEQQIIIYGRSLGTGIAVKISSENKPRNLILETPYYNLNDVAQKWLLIFPTGLTLRYKMPSNTYIQDVSCPITIFHGTSDRVVPYRSGLRLFNCISNSNKKMITIPEGSHNDLIKFSEYLTDIDIALEQKKE